MDLRHIEVKLARATTLPILPNVVVQVLNLTDNPSANARDYERVISQDAGLATKVLRTANSPYFCGTKEITTVQRAIIQLGVNTLRSICLTVAYQSSIMNKKLDPRFIVNDFWKHSLAVACGSKILARLTRSPLVEEAFIAGLMHDIGKLALCIFLPAEAAQVYKAVEADNLTHYDAEMRELGVTHQEIGAMAAKLWSLPEVYHMPIAHHHTPTEAGNSVDPLTAIVHTANGLAHEMELGFSISGEINQIDPSIREFLCIPDAQYESICAAVYTEVATVGKHLGV